MTYAFLTQPFQVPHLDGVGLQAMVASINAADALLSYIQEELVLPTNHIRDIKAYSTRDILSIDRVSQRHLELTESLSDGGRKNTLLSVIDQTQTPMGGRLIREWLKKPLLSVEEITRRHDAVDALYTRSQLRAGLREHLSKVRDLERLMMKVSTKYATPRDLLTLALSLEKILPIKKLVNQATSELLLKCAQKLVDLSDLIALVKRALVEEPPLKIAEGNIFRTGFHAPLDELREITKGGKAWLARYQRDSKD